MAPFEVTFTWIFAWSFESDCLVLNLFGLAKRFFFLGGGEILPLFSSKETPENLWAIALLRFKG